MADSKWGKEDKYRDWIFILYPESMVDDWQERIGSILQVPLCYIIHDKDDFKIETNEEERKVHVHLWVHWKNTVWNGAIMKVINKFLSKDGCKACSTADPVFNDEVAWLYLIHKDSKSMKQSWKHQYDDSERILLNNFDIGSYIDVSSKEIQFLKSKIVHFIIDNGYFDINDAFLGCEDAFGSSSHEMYVFNNFNSYFDKICCSNYKKMIRRLKGLKINSLNELDDFIEGLNV